MGNLLPIIIKLDMIDPYFIIQELNELPHRKQRGIDRNLYYRPGGVTF